MSRQIANVATSIDWSDAATIEQPDSVAYDVVVASASVSYQEGSGWPPQYGGPPKFLPPGGYSFRRAVSGLRFRDRVAGVHATVTAELVSRFDDDPTLERLPRAARRLDESPPRRSPWRSLLGRDG